MRRYIAGIDEIAQPSSFLAYHHGAVAVVIAPFFTAIIIATRQAVEMSSLSNVVLTLLVGLRQIEFGEIVDVAIFDLVREAILHGALIDGRVE